MIDNRGEGLKQIIDRQRLFEERFNKKGRVEESIFEKQESLRNSDYMRELHYMSEIPEQDNLNMEMSAITINHYN